MAPRQSVDHQAPELSATVAAPKPAASSIFQRFLQPLIGVINPLILRLAGRRWSPTASVLKHRGHRSGRVYSTPVSALPRGGFFWIGLAFGEDAGWARNALAAGECELRYRGADYRLIEPVVVDRASARSQLPHLLRIAGPMLGIHKILRMRAVGT